MFAEVEEAEPQRPLSSVAGSPRGLAAGEDSASRMCKNAAIGLVEDSSFLVSAVDVALAGDCPEAAAGVAEGKGSAAAVVVDDEAPGTDGC